MIFLVICDVLQSMQNSIIPDKNHFYDNLHILSNSAWGKTESLQKYHILTQLGKSAWHIYSVKIRKDKKSRFQATKDL